MKRHKDDHCFRDSLSFPQDWETPLGYLRLISIDDEILTGARFGVVYRCELKACTPLYRSKKKFDGGEDVPIEY